MKTDSKDFFIIRLLGNNVWISIGLFVSGLFLLNYSDSAVVIKVIRWILPNLSREFVQNVFFNVGTVMMVSAFGTFFFWIKTHEKKRKNKRKLTMEQAAGEMNWNFTATVPPHLSRQIDSLVEDILFTVNPNFICRYKTISHILIKELNGDQLAIMDIELSGSSPNNNNDSSFAIFETAYLVISKRLELPCFQTQTRIKFGIGLVDNLINSASGVTEIQIPHRLNFAEKYILSGQEERVLNTLTPAMLDYYEQNQLYRTIGRDKMLCLSTLQTEPTNQFQINQNLQILHRLFQLLKSK